MKPLKNFFLIVWILVLLSGSIISGSAEAAIIKLNSTLPTDSLIYDWQASLDSGIVVYSTGPNRAYRNVLFSVPAGGGTAVQITPPVTGDERIISYQISPNSTRVVFLMRPSEYAASEIYSVPIGGGAVTKLNENISSQVNTFLFTPDSQKVVYQAVVPVINQWGLYSVPLAGPANSSVRIDDNPSYHVDSGFKISPDSTRVVYRAPCLYGPDAGQSCTGMYSVPVAGGPSAKLSLDGTNYSVASGIEISPDSQYLVYRAYYPPDWSFDIYSIPIAGTPSNLLRLSHYIAGSVATWQISPDSSRVVFIAMQDTAGTSELYSIPIRLTGSVVKLNGALATDGQVIEYAISPDGSRVVYKSLKESSSDTYEIYSAPLAGPAGQAFRLNESLTGTGLGVRRFKVSPTSQRVVFEILFCSGTSDWCLFSVPATGPANQQVPIGNLEANSFFDASYNSDWVFYIKGGNLLKAPISGPASNTITLDGPPSHVADAFLQTPNGVKLIYSAESFGNLYAVDAVISSTSSDLVITKSASPNPVLAGTSLTYTIDVTNQGPNEALGVTVTDTLPSGPAFVSATSTKGTCAHAGGIVTCGIGSLANGGAATVTITVTPGAAGWIRNKTQVSSSVYDPNSANNTAFQDTQVYTPEDPDSDGVSSTQESGSAGTDPAYDGNLDGTADRLQSNVTSLPTSTGSYYVTLASPAGTSLGNLQAKDNPSPGDSPSGVTFPYGFFDFTVNGLTPGGATTVTLYLPAGAAPNTYYKYGPTPGNTAPHWYEFLYDGQTGAVILGNVITLHFVDGLRGDDDLTADGIIIDQGGPGLKLEDNKLYLPLIRR